MPRKPSQQALRKFEEEFEKRFGAGSIARPTTRAYKVVSTGSLTLDYAMGCGGWVVGRIGEVWGTSSSAKTTMMLRSAANFQRTFPDRSVAWVNMEQTFDPAWAETNGVDLKRIEVITPTSSEDVSDMTKMAIRSQYFSFIALDSVGGMVTEEELEKDADETSVGTAAKVVTRMVKTAAVLCAETETTLVVVNQVRANLARYGPDQGRPGGFALEHVTTHRIKLRRTGTDKYTIGSGDNAEVVGFELSATVETNKVAPAKRVATFGLFVQASEKYGPVGIDQATEAFTMGTRMGIIDQPSKGYYLLPDSDQKINGRDKVIAALREDEQAVKHIRRLMLDDVSSEVKDTAPVQDTDTAVEDDTLDFATGAPQTEPDLDVLAKLEKST